MKPVSLLLLPVFTVAAEVCVKREDKIVNHCTLLNQLDGISQQAQPALLLPCKPTLGLLRLCRGNQETPACMRFTQALSEMDLPGVKGGEMFRLFDKDDFEAPWTKLAERGQWIVYKVKPTLWRKTFAMKCFASDFTGSSFYRSIMEEASKLEKVMFSYLVSVYGVCTNPPGLLMDFMSNGSLDGLLQSHEVMWPKKFQMIHEVAMGLNFLHNMQPPLLHINLKPSNVLLDHNLHVKIADFGMVKWTDFSDHMEFVELMAARGNISYIPPEIFAESPDPPGTSYDVYSFAIVTWEILTQKKPYPGAASMMSVIMKVSCGKRPALEKINEDQLWEGDTMVAIIQQCWQQKSSDRPCFSDIVKDTEILSDLLKIPDVILPCGKESLHKEAFSTLSTCLMGGCCSKTTSTSAPTESTDITGLLDRKDFEAFKELVREEDALVTYPGQNSLLHYAASCGDPRPVRHVLDLGMAVDSVNSQGHTALMLAALQGFHTVCALLLEAGAEPDRPDTDGWTALHFAAQGGHERVARLLLEGGASAHVAEKDGWKPLHLAAQNGQENVARLLLSRMTTVDGCTRDGRSSLHLAAVYGHLGIVKVLLVRGADPNGGDNGDTPLHLAVQEGHFRVARLLVKSGVDVARADEQGCSAVHLAALQGHALICRLLLDRDTTLLSQTYQGWTPMHLAALRGQLAAVRVLAEQGAAVNEVGPGGWSPLHLACQGGHESVVSELLSLGAEPNSREERGWTPLHMACGRASVISCAVRLISHGAEVNSRTCSGATPLHLAAASGNIPVVETLLLNGADGEARDEQGFTARELAAQSSREEVLRLLDPGAIQTS